MKERVAGRNSRCYQHERYFIISYRRPAFINRFGFRFYIVLNESRKEFCGYSSEGIAEPLNIGKGRDRSASGTPAGKPGAMPGKEVARAVRKRALLRLF
jgi:hypothetical protein